MQEKFKRSTIFHKSRFLRLTIFNVFTVSGLITLVRKYFFPVTGKDFFIADPVTI